MKIDKSKFSWTYLTAAQYWDIYDILNSGNPDLNKQVQLVSLISGLEESQIWELPIEEATDLINQLSFLEDFKLLDNFKPKSIKVGNLELKLIQDISKLTYAQYVDFQNYIQEPLRTNYYKVLSVFMVPKGSKYNEGYDLLDIQALIRENLTWQQVQSLLAFFLNKLVSLIVNSLTYCQLQMKISKKKRQQLEPHYQNLIQQLHTLGSLCSKE